MAKIYNNILETIGRTPLVKLNRITDGAKATVLLKLEFFNPLGSVKDRIGLAMINYLEKTQGIAPGKTTLIEATSGNTGIALAFVAAAKGYDLIITMPDSASTERKKLLKILGARLVLTEGAKGMKGAIAKAEELKAQIKDSAIPSQFESPANPEIHKETTGPEIWEDTDGKVDILISGVGTGGTITGVAEYIKPKKASFKAIALEPEGSPVISGGEPGKHRLQGLGAGFIPKTLHTDVIDETIRVSEADAAEYAKRTCREEGIPVGISSGAAVWAACEVAKRPENEGKLIVAIIPSSAERYLSTWLFEDISSESDDISDLLKG
jgi:cysteine synthase A